MFIFKTEDFIKGFEKLPAGIKKIYRKQENIFKVNWLDSRLHAKRLKELKGVYSFRIIGKRFIKKNFIRTISY